MPNFIAFGMLSIWPLVMVVLFKKLSPDRALIWSFLGALLLLPSGAEIDAPLIPALDKESIPSVTALVLCLTMIPQRIRFFPASRLVAILMIIFLISPLVTVLNNQEPVFWGPFVIPQLTVREVLSETLNHIIILIPFILAFNLLNTQQARKSFLTATMVAMLLYSVLMLIEIRLSPQLSTWLYGIGPEVFAQQIRFGGFRPVVFMGHGLVVAFFTLLAVTASAILWRASDSVMRTPYFFALCYLFVVLILSKTVGAILTAVVFLPFILFAGSRVKGWVVMATAIFVLAYPVLRSADLIPVDKLVGYAALIQEERAQSLEFRFDNEEMLLERAAMKPFTGWGFWGRNRILDVYTGMDLSVTDGYWVIVIGSLGWVGYVGVFGLLTTPLMRLWYRRGKAAALNDPHIVFGIGLLLAINLIDLIPNSTIRNVSWIMAGTLLAATLRSAKPVTNPAPAGQIEPAAKPQRHTRKPRSAQYANDTTETAAFQRRARSPR